jgi:hypothetical protein
MNICSEVDLCGSTIGGKAVSHESRWVGYTYRSFCRRTYRRWRELWKSKGYLYRPFPSDGLCPRRPHIFFGKCIRVALCLSSNMGAEWGSFLVIFADSEKSIYIIIGSCKMSCWCWFEMASILHLMSLLITRVWKGGVGGGRRRWEWDGGWDGGWGIGTRGKNKSGYKKKWS